MSRRRLRGWLPAISRDSARADNRDRYKVRADSRDRHRDRADSRVSARAARDSCPLQAQ